MALDVVSGNSNYGNSISASRPEVMAQASGAAHATVTERPVLKVSENKQSEEQERGAKDSHTSEEQLKNAISHANNRLKQARTRCEFSYHEKTNRVSIKVFDRDTEEIIREIPPEEALEMLEKMWEVAGFLVDERR